MKVIFYLKTPIVMSLSGDTRVSDLKKLAREMDCKAEISFYCGKKEVVGRI